MGLYSLANWPLLPLSTPGHSRVCCLCCQGASESEVRCGWGALGGAGCPRAGEQDRGLLLPRAPPAEGPVCASSQPHSPPPAQLLTACLHPQPAHPGSVPKGLLQDVISTIGQAFELRFKQYLRSPPRLVTPHDRCAGEAGGGAGKQPHSRGPTGQELERRPALPQSSSEKGAGKGNSLRAPASCYS